MNKILVICGATATGKTALAVECALKLNTEIISADSQLVYKGLNIGTAKPTIDEMRGVKHHMIDVACTTATFSVSDYVSSAEPILNNLLLNNRVPIVCGGTGFYINSLLFNLSYGNTAADTEIRNKYNDILQKHGKEYLYEILVKTDIDTAKKLHPNDVKRVIRALEIYEVSGFKKSEINDCFEKKHDYLAVAVNYPREELYERIDRRVDKMLENGLMEEVKALLDSGIDERYQCMQAIGYKEVIEYYKNSYNYSTMRDIIKLNTRHYAKRQLTFFKKLNNVVWLAPDDANADKILELLHG